MEFNYEVNPDYNAFYRNGLEFQKAAERCLAMDDDGSIHMFQDNRICILVAPAVVNSSFACEMYLKSLILKSGKTYPTGKNGHNLKYMFDMLPESMRDIIIQSCCSGASNAEDRFDSFLDEHSKDFVDARYYVTKEGWQGMSPILVYTYTHNIGVITKYLLDSCKEEML